MNNKKQHTKHWCENIHQAKWFFVDPMKLIFFLHILSYFFFSYDVLYTSRSLVARRAQCVIFLGITVNNSQMQPNAVMNRIHVQNLVVIRGGGENLKILVGNSGGWPDHGTQANSGNLGKFLPIRMAGLDVMPSQTGRITVLCNT